MDAKTATDGQQMLRMPSTEAAILGSCHPRVVSSADFNRHKDFNGHTDFNRYADFNGYNINLDWEHLI